MEFLSGREGYTNEPGGAMDFSRNFGALRWTAHSIGSLSQLRELACVEPREEPYESDRSEVRRQE